MRAWSASVLIFTQSLSSFTLATSTQPQNSSCISGYWLPAIASKSQGEVPFNVNSATYKVYRDVRAYGATGDGITDDTEAINRAISDGNRCGPNCDSSTTTPALVYFPTGTYLVSKPIVQYYYTQIVGDAKQLPTLKASASFEGISVIDADPYIPGGGGATWYTNQNNFYRQIRNIIIDIQDTKGAAGIHWQVSQATSIQNVRFEMADGGAHNDQKGIFQESGSGGFMSDLIFNGGSIGALLGSQQYTTRNLTFNRCRIGIYMTWNWLWTMKSNTFNKCELGLDMANAPQNQTVGSVIMLDSNFIDTAIGINTSFSSSSSPITAGSLILDNIDFTGTSKAAVQSFTGDVILPAGHKIASWVQGNVLTANRTQHRVQGNNTRVTTKPRRLLGENGFFERSKPQYENLSISSFVSLKSVGAKGDGRTDDTAAIQCAIDRLTSDQVLFVDHGAYLISDTIRVPAYQHAKIVGEAWPMFMIAGQNFADMDNPRPAFVIGKKSGEKGTFEMSDCIITTQGSAPGAILMEWNINGENGEAGMWDVHFRVAGFDGAKLQSSNCNRNQHPANATCLGSFLQLHITESANGYFENVWLWTADHELDQSDHSQIDIYNGRGMLVESQGPVWLYGTASEHSILSQYHFQGAKDIFLGAVQTETPYMQPNTDAATPFKVNPSYFDPNLIQKSDNTAWALRIIDSSSIWMYGAGTYSFFQDYNQSCVTTQDCQVDINQIENSTNVNIFGLSTKGSVNMLTSKASGLALDSENRSNFCATLAAFQQV